MYIRNMGNGFICVKLYLGIYDSYRRRVRRAYRKYGGGVEGGAGLCGRGGYFVRHHDWRDGLVGRFNGNRAEIRFNRQNDKRNFAFYLVSFSENSKEPSGAGIYFHQFDCEYSRPRMGLHAGGALSYYSDRLKNSLKNQGFPPI